MHISRCKYFFKLRSVKWKLLDSTKNFAEVFCNDLVFVHGADSIIRLIIFILSRKLCTKSHGNADAAHTVHLRRVFNHIRACRTEFIESSYRTLNINNNSFIPQKALFAIAASLNMTCSSFLFEIFLVQIGEVKEAENASWELRLRSHWKYSKNRDFCIRTKAPKSTRTESKQCMKIPANRTKRMTEYSAKCAPQTPNAPIEREHIQMCYGCRAIWLMTILLFAEKLLSVIVGAEQFIKIKTGKRRPEKRRRRPWCWVNGCKTKRKSPANDANHTEVQIIDSAQWLCSQRNWVFGNHPRRNTKQKHVLVQKYSVYMFDVSGLWFLEPKIWD